MARLRAGQLLHVLSLESQMETPGESGGFETSWLEVAKLGADVRPVSGKELLIAGQRQVTATHRVRIRYREGVTSPSSSILYRRKSPGYLDKDGDNVASPRSDQRHDL
jgi:SPP1 family predicted phage head-tail adaptor